MHARAAVLRDQAVPLAGAGGSADARPSTTPSAFAWSESYREGTLLAAGGGAPGTVHLWNLQQELCTEQARPCQHSPSCPSAL
jgi:hypothetical protein